MAKKHRNPAFLVNPFVPAGIAIVLLVLTLMCGCSSPRPDSSQPEAGGYTEPVVGTWVHDPGTADSPLFLYIFKDYGRFDALAMPRDGAKPLSYEEWVTGTWAGQGTMEYLLHGQVIRNDFMTGSHTALTVNETLVYDPQNDILFNRAHPAGVYQRFSHEPVIPPGLDASIPWD
jgi:hypothetical protein